MVARFGWNGANPWWEIDLEGEYMLDNITVLAPARFCFQVTV